jgi:molybdenum cofactor cytidylyltransferase
MGGSTAAVVLAAGGGSRFGGAGHKLTSLLRGRPVVWWALESAWAADIGPLIVVTGAVELEPEWIPEHAQVVANSRWSEGQATSLQCALDAARQRGLGSIVVGLGDQPFIPPEAWRAVALSPASIAVASYEGTRGNPVRLGADVWPLLPRDGDAGARSLMASRPELVTEVPCPGNPADIDTLEDLARWNS